ncbi:MAG TPA: hypothetical protein VJP79_11345, partial [Nitrososphaera sp.]|nr:hypothetical protein [Nitrososphaera sp.]
MSPAEAAVSNAKVIITTEDEACLVSERKGTIMLETELEKYPSVSKAKILRSLAAPDSDDR